ncbi:hypothetical protein [Deinococcus sp. AJ005]|uniref:hypothetical protein n=1 Tax=Deinococcus sp. AJ005 TaxID=2652443 RepID=UPI00125CB256|nr:hypothetical protein [Deinococcus sp. AJ005]QFP77489.1 hypothetical protein DAAJ005_14225 [Deinococcus sp. AJ005]
MNSELQRWLDTATHTLAPSATQRIQDEYRSAFADAQAAGDTNILAAWGDPRRVNRELRRVHLTVADMKVLSAIAPSPWGAATKGWFVQKIWWSTPLLIGIYGLLGYKAFDLTWFQALAGSTLFGVVFAAGLLWGERQTTLSSTREEAGISGLCISVGMFAAALALIPQLPWPAPMQMQGFLFAVIALLLLVTVWSGWLWRKVRRAELVA